MPIAKRRWSAAAADHRGLHCEAFQSQACLDLLDVVEGACSQDIVTEAVQAIQGVIGKAADLSGMPLMIFFQKIRAPLWMCTATAII